MSATGETASARPVKSASAFRTIGEVADDLDLPAHVLRFWESKFPQLKPLKRGGGRRYYRPEDIALLRRIRQCLYQDGYTIRGVQKLLGDPSGEFASGFHEPPVNEDGAAMPNLFSLEAASDPPGESPGAPGQPPDEPPGAQPPPRRPSRRPPRPDGPDAATRSALEEIRRDLREACALLDDLVSRNNG